MRLKHVLTFGSGVLLCTLAQMALAAEIYPSPPVKLIVQGAVGSGPDVLARIVGQHRRLDAGCGRMARALLRRAPGGLRPPDRGYLRHCSVLLSQRPLAVLAAVILGNTSKSAAAASFGAT